ncbi:transglutaminase family protein [Alishewanella sp. HL-SH06]|uniref:transglutaminase family protein n=1 Tax=Alishewanella sp. HL-SH06 TaxID=3461144 RepID=UPI004042D70D
MNYQLKHLTEYQYEHAVANSYNLACLMPRQLPYQHVSQASVRLTPDLGHISQYQDYFGNTRHLIHLQPPHQQLKVCSEALVEVLPRHNSALLDSGSGVDIPQLQHYLNNNLTAAAMQAKLFCQASKLAPFLTETAALLPPLRAPKQTLLQLVECLNQYIFEHFIYTPGFTTVVTPLTEVLQHRRGVCQDFAQLAISCLRANGIPCRYVSGYLETQPPPGQARLQGADASHAWFAVFDPELGWIDFDPTNNLLPCQQHLTLAFGRDYADVVPLKGVVQGSGAHQLQVAVDVIPC